MDPHALPLLLQELGHVGRIRHHAVVGDGGACHHLESREEGGGGQEEGRGIEGEERWRTGRKEDIEEDRMLEKRRDMDS